MIPAKIFLRNCIVCNTCDVFTFAYAELFLNWALASLTEISSRSGSSIFSEKWRELSWYFLLVLVPILTTDIGPNIYRYQCWFGPKWNLTFTVLFNFSRDKSGSFVAIARYGSELISTFLQVYVQCIQLTKRTIIGPLQGLCSYLRPAFKFILQVDNEERKNSRPGVGWESPGPGLSASDRLWNWFFS